MEIPAPIDSIQARESLNVSQAEVARQTGLSRTYLSEFECGKRKLEYPWQCALSDYYGSHGWGRTEPHDLFHDELEHASLSSRSRSRFEFEISASLPKNDVDALLDEYSESCKQLEKLGQATLRKGLFGGLDEMDGLWQARHYLAKAVRQVQILQTLQGLELPVSRAGFDYRDFSTVKTIREYIEHLNAD